RRFAEQEPARHQNDPDGKRILMAAQPEAVQKSDPERGQFKKVDEQFLAKATELQKQLRDKEAVENGNPATLQEIRTQQVLQQQAQGEIAASTTSLDAYERFMARTVLGGFVIGALLFGLFALYLGMRRLSRGRPATAFFAVGACVLLFLFMGS